MTYRQAGVDIDAGNRAVELIKQRVKGTLRPEVLAGVGGFGGLFALNAQGVQEPVLVAATDGVGTKLKIAFQMGRHDTVGRDLVAMNVNDLLVTGAEPLFFLDYLAVGRLDPEQAAAIVGGIADGCQEAGCALIGGETAEMPGFYAPGEYDLAGFAVGLVDRGALVDGREVRPGDAVIGLPSSGLHSNGYSLVRRVVAEAGLRLDQPVAELGGVLGDVLLEPTRIYVRSVLSLLKGTAVKAMAHITGGGLLENIPRSLPEGVGVVLHRSAFPDLPIFSFLARLGRIPLPEMARTFNLGIGFVLIVEPAVADGAVRHFCDQGIPARIVGEVAGNRAGVELLGTAGGV